MMNKLLMQPPAGQPAPMGPPPGPGGGAPPPQQSPEQIADARAHMGVMVRGLLGLSAQPRGSLTKQSVFDAMAEMIANGAFSTPQAKRQLVAEMAQMPDDEAAIRQVVGQHLLRLNEVAEQLTHHFGPEG